MLKVIFKNVEPSQLAKDLVYGKFGLLIEKFPDLNGHKLQIFLSMENSITKSGVDSFVVKVVIVGKKYGGLVLQKDNQNLYRALDDLFDVIADYINRKGDKKRVKSRKLQRKHKNAC